MMRLKNRLFAAVLSCTFILSGMTVSATDTGDVPADTKSAEAGTTDNAAAVTEEELEKQMDAQFAILPESNSSEGWPKGPQVKADAAVVMDIGTGTILYGKQVDKQEYPASITKIMTALLALENGDIHTDKVTFSEASTGFLEYGDAQIGMTPGEEISLEDAMYGMLLASANEVSYAVAESIGNKLGIGYSGFIDKMTERAKELGCENTHFMNANGLHDDQHYVSAKDMALISAEAFKHEEFRTVIKSLEHTIGATNQVSEPRVFQQNHKMLYPASQYFYEYCQGGKTGYTDQARTTLVTYAEKNGMQLVCVVLRTRGGVAYEETKSLLDYGFDNFTKQQLSRTESSSDIEEIPEEAYVVLPAGASFSDLKMKLAQKEKGSTEAVASYTYKGVSVGNAEVTLSEKYINEQKTKEKAEKAKAVEARETRKGLPLWAKILIGIIAAVVVLFAGITALAVHRRNLRRRRRQMMRRRKARKDSRNTRDFKDRSGRIRP